MSSTPGRSGGPHSPKLLVLTGTTAETVAAVSCGAQAVGFVTGFGSDDARGCEPESGSRHEAIRRATHYCRVRGVQVYGILNSPENAAREYTQSSVEAALYRAGAECAVANSPAALGAARRAFPDWPVWAGLGFAVHNVDSAVALEQAGVSGVILPPELTAGEIAEIAGRTSVELAAFVHQKLCTFYAGHCVSPGPLQPRSEPGECDNWCRREYTLEADEPGDAGALSGRRALRRLLSVKALEALPVLRELVGARLGCLIVDGAFGGPEHVAIVTGVYIAALGRLAHSRGAFAAKASEMSLLAAASGAELSAGYYERGQRAPIASPKWPGGHEGGARETIDADALAAARARIAAGPRRVPVYMRATARVGDVLHLELTDGEGHTVSVCGLAAAEAARTAPLSHEYLNRQLSRLGETPFVLADLRCELDGAAIVPVSDISDVRRRAVLALEQVRAAPREDPIGDYTFTLRMPAAILPAGRLEVAARVSTAESAAAAAEAGAGLICIGGEAFVPRSAVGMSEILDASGAAHGAGAKLYYGSSRIIHDREMNAAREGLRRAVDAGADGFLVANLGLMGLAAQLAPGSVVADWSLGIADPNGWSVLFAMGATRFIVPPWLGWGNTCALVEALGPHAPEVFMFGRVELGVSEYCVVESVMGGRSGRRACLAPCMRGAFSLRDGAGHVLPVRCDRSCRMHVFDCDELHRVAYLPALGRLGTGRVWLDLRGEPTSRVADLCQEYVCAARQVLGSLSS